MIPISSFQRRKVQTITSVKSSTSKVPSVVWKTAVLIFLSVIYMLIAMLKNGIYDDIIDRRLHIPESTWQQPPGRLAVGKEILNDLLNFHFTELNSTVVESVINKKAIQRFFITDHKKICSWYFRGNTAAFCRKYIDRKVEGWTKSLLNKIGRFFYCFRHCSET